MIFFSEHRSLLPLILCPQNANIQWRQNIDIEITIENSQVSISIVLLLDRFEIIVSAHGKVWFTLV